MPTRPTDWEVCSRFLASAYGIPVTSPVNPCEACGAQPTDNFPVRFVHLGLNKLEDRQTRRTLFVVLSPENSDPIATCQDCARAFMSLTLTLGF
jgi:hypothetical protein